MTRQRLDAPSRAAQGGVPGTARHTGSIELAVILGDAVTSRALPERGTVVIGRDEGCDLRIDHPSVSRRHAALHVGPTLAIEDLGAANGTRISEMRDVTLSGDTHDMRTIRASMAEVAIGDTLLLGVAVLVVRGPSSPVSFGAAGDHAGLGAVVADPAMRALYGQVDRIALAPSSVLLLGETGVGKEVLARAIHDRSPRAGGPFVAVNCGTLPESLIDAQLFGHEANAFTGAGKAKPGLFQAARGGTIFLDEIGDLPLGAQVKLLRVLQERKVTPVGAVAPQDIDVRVVSATHRDVDAEVAAGRFREDLSYRLNTITLTIPPLRQRVSEIAPLALLFVMDACAQLRRVWTPSLGPETIHVLERYPWPGNIRELRNAIERAVVLCAGDTLLPEHLPPKVVGGLTDRPPPAAPSPGAEDRAGTVADLEAQLTAANRRRVVEALAQTGGHQARAALLLDVSLRTLQNRMDEYDIPRPGAKR